MRRWHLSFIQSTVMESNSTRGTQGPTSQTEELSILGLCITVPSAWKVLAHLYIADSSWPSRPQPKANFSERPPDLKGLPLSPHNPALLLHRAQFSYLFTCLLSASLTVSYRRAGITSVLFMAVLLELKAMPLREQMLKKICQINKRK